LGIKGEGVNPQTLADFFDTSKNRGDFSLLENWGRAIVWTEVEILTAGFLLEEKLPPSVRLGPQFFDYEVCGGYPLR
jgi:hypothetical protein